VIQGSTVKRVTIYSIAEICGVTPGTVSRAFTRPELVKDSVRERILAVAGSMGYRPNRAARVLATGRASMLGLLVPDITNPFMPPLVRAIQQAAASLDYSVLLVDADESAAAEPHLVSRLHTQVDGLVLASPRAPASALRQAAADLPFVVVNRILRDAPAAVCDNTEALSSAGRHLEDLGHRRVALLCGPPASWAAQRRAGAIRTWAAQAGVTLVEVGPFEASFEGGRSAGAAFLETDATAAFAFDDVTACGVLAELADQRVPVPGERSVVGCDDVLLASMVTPSLTTVTAPVEKLGQLAVDLLQERITGAAGRGTVVRVNGMLTLRSSTGAAPRAG
jgi:LacI family transcriptional regulator